MIKSENNKQEQSPADNKSEKEDKEQKEKVETPEEKLKSTQEKLLRSMAETENQRWRLEKENQ